MIPEDAEKPADPRQEKKQAITLSSDLAHVFEATTLPIPRDNPYATFDTVSEERLRLAYEVELSYLRGDFERVISCFHKTEGDDAARLRVSSTAIAAAISVGNFPIYAGLKPT